MRRLPSAVAAILSTLACPGAALGAGGWQRPSEAVVLSADGAVQPRPRFGPAAGAGADAEERPDQVLLAVSSLVRREPVHGAVSFTLPPTAEPVAAEAPEQAAETQQTDLLHDDSQRSSKMKKRAQNLQRSRKSSQTRTESSSNYVLVNGAGACGEGFIDKSTEFDTENCGAACMNHARCAYFAFGADNKDCVLFTASGCPHDDRYPQYQSFRVLRPAGSAIGAAVQESNSAKALLEVSSMNASATATAAPEGHVELVLPLANRSGKIVGEISRVTDKICDYSQHACIKALMTSGYYIGGYLYPFARNYRTTGCFYYAEGSLQGRGFYGTVNNLDVRDDAELTLTNKSVLLKRPPGYPLCHDAARPASSCQQLGNHNQHHNSTNVGCSEYGMPWNKLAEDVTQAECSEKCVAEMSSYGGGGKGRLCCYFSENFGCWSKQNALPTVVGTGKSAQCDFDDMIV